MPGPGRRTGAASLSPLYTRACARGAGSRGRAPPEPAAATMRVAPCQTLAAPPRSAARRLPHTRRLPAPRSARPLGLPPLPPLLCRRHSAPRLLGCRRPPRRAPPRRPPLLQLRRPRGARGSRGAPQPSLGAGRGAGHCATGCGFRGFWGASGCRQGALMVAVTHSPAQHASCTGPAAHELWPCASTRSRVPPAGGCAVILHESPQRCRVGLRREERARRRGGLVHAPQQHQIAFGR